MIYYSRIKDMTDSGRLAWIDNLRSLMIIFVVMIHAAVTYGGLGDWYYVENEKVDMASTLIFAFFQTFTQAYFMSVLFLIAGYFTQNSLLRKSTGSFISGRMARLGLPLVIYVFLIHPLCVKLAYPDIDLAKFYLNGILELRFFSWTGPLWFVEALLIFSLAYTLIQKTILKKPLKFSFRINSIHSFVLIMVITITAFFTRLVFPIGTDVTNLQLGFFPGYLVMFAFGIYVYNHDVFRQLPGKNVKRWLLISLVIGVPFWLLIIFCGGPLKGEMLIEGGMNWPAFLYALWESIICVTFSFVLIGLFQDRFNHQGAFRRFLSDNAFGVFVFHAPVLISISILLKTIEIPPLVKFAIASLLALAFSFSFSWLVRRIRIFRMIFS